MKKTILSTAITALALTTTMGVQAEGFDQAIKDTTADFNFRLRAESADQDNGTVRDAALATTLKSRVTIKTGEISGLSVLLEGDNTLHIVDDFWDKQNNNTTNDVVLDHETTQFNQAYLQYNGFDSTVKVGNQRIVLDNQRHVGGVAFRQDEATFDAVSVTNKSVENATIFAAIANNRNTIFNTNTEEDILLANVKYAVNTDLAVSGYYYGITTTADVDRDTFGVRATGTAGPGIKFEAELATQALSTADTTTAYYHFSAAKKLGSVMAKVGYEVLGSDDGAASFGTPLGTNHKFLGWTDGHLQATNDGIQDLYVSAVTKVSDVKLVGQIHSFSPDNGSADLGTEVGFLAATKIKNYGVSLKLSQLTGSDASVDTTKVWLTGTAKF